MYKYGGEKEGKGMRGCGGGVITVIRHTGFPSGKCLGEWCKSKVKEKCFYSYERIATVSGVEGIFSSRSSTARTINRSGRKRMDRKVFVT